MSRKRIIAKDKHGIPLILNTYRNGTKTMHGLSIASEIELDPDTARKIAYAMHQFINREESPR